ncbi:MAG TPA: TetR/AcrR family transcriptional regulator [Microthrixaceae bacterium]|nr:TetR/AcrR family transcriptional regulator [Microthrixaceae bacterium]
MPRVVDVEARRRELSDALWRIVRREGIGGVTVRAVAAEAGVSAGMVQHYFRTQDELIEFAMYQALQQMAERVRQVDLSEPDLESAMAALEAVLPLDEQRRAEAQVWLAMLSRRHARPSLGQQGTMVDDALREGIRVGLEGLVRAGLVDDGRDLEVEVVRLHALIDGLSVHGLGDPPWLGPNEIRAALLAHLRDLTR